MSWEDQGRQYHMWFGHGTASENGKEADPDPSVTSQGTEQRALAVAYGVIAAVPSSLRGPVEAQYSRGTLSRLKAAMTSWMQGTRLDPATFAARFFGRQAGDPVANALHSAAILAATATSHADLRAAAAKVAVAIQFVGIDRWSRFVAESSERARDPVTLAAVEKSRQPADPARDAIRPVYPIETAIGVVAAGVTGGAAAAARSVGGAMLRQLLPGKPNAPTTLVSPVKETGVSTATPHNVSAASVADKLDRYLLNPTHSKGGSKAEWFEKALGFNRANSGDLAKQLVFDEATAIPTGVTEFGNTFNQTISVVGANGRTATVVTGWIKPADGIPRLVTAFPGAKP